MSLKYRLNTLGWYNFEGLIQSLLKELIGSGVTSLGGSKDGGKDASFSGEAPFPSTETRWTGEWIFQVKYSEIESSSGTTEYNQLLRQTKEEIEKIQKRRNGWPDNYILVTNIKLTVKSHDNLVSFANKIGFTGNFHIMDGNDVCQLLDKYQNIRRSFPQLIGLADIDKVINRRLYNRSKSFVARWQSKLSTFVTVKPYWAALERLNKHHFVVIDGAPQVGKSFIGAALSFVCAREGFEIFDIREPSEFFDVYDSSLKQIFYADDAVGTTRFDPTLGNQWSRDLSGIHIRLDNTHKLIWTARSYVLEEAIAVSKIRENYNNFPDLHEVLVEVKEFSETEKALILYNHVKNFGFSKVVREYIKSKEFLNHVLYSPNFTPERIRQLVQQIIPKLKEPLTSDDKKEWEKEIKEFLQHPDEAYKRAYDSLGKSEKIMLLALLDKGIRSSKKELHKEYDRRISLV